MKTSLTDTKQIEYLLEGSLDAQDAVVLEARLLLEPDLQQKLQWQKHTYELVRLYGRNKLKAEIEAVHQNLFKNTKHQGFRERVYSLFRRH